MTGKKKGKIKITDEVRRTIIRQLKQGYKPKVIADKLGLHWLTVSTIGRAAGVWKSPNPTKASAATPRAATTYAAWINSGLEHGWLVARVTNEQTIEVELASR